MRGMGAFQMAQTKHRDARVFALGQHLRSAIDLMEQIATEPFRPLGPTLPALETEIASPPELPDEKLAYTVKGVAIALTVGRTTICKAIADGRLVTVKLACVSAWRPRPARGAAKLKKNTDTDCFTTRVACDTTRKTSILTPMADRVCRGTRSPPRPPGCTRLYHNAFDAMDKRQIASRCAHAASR